MIRVFDIIFSTVGLLILSPVILTLIIIGYFDTGSPIFRQQRVGRHKRPFFLLKLRSMHIETLSKATHLTEPSSITEWGSFLRKTKLDELPQLMNVIIGDMSLVGPRPSLFTQTELIKERNTRGVYVVRPGITGLAQIQKIDMETPKLLAETDAKMISNYNVFNYFKYIFFTLLGKAYRYRIKN